MKHECAFDGRKREEQQMDVCSSRECTGLIPAGISSEEELEFYEELYPFLPNPVTEKEKE